MHINKNIQNQLTNFKIKVTYVTLIFNNLFQTSYLIKTFSKCQCFSNYFEDCLGKTRLGRIAAPTPPSLLMRRG